MAQVVERTQLRANISRARARVQCNYDLRVRPSALARARYNYFKRLEATTASGNEKPLLLLCVAARQRLIDQRARVEFSGQIKQQQQQQLQTSKQVRAHATPIGYLQADNLWRASREPTRNCCFALAARQTLVVAAVYKCARPQAIIL